MSKQNFQSRKLGTHFAFQSLNFKSIVLDILDKLLSPYWEETRLIDLNIHP